MQGYRSWRLETQGCALGYLSAALRAALRSRDYDVRFVYGQGGYNGNHGGAILPDSLRWLWRDHADAIEARRNPLLHLLPTFYVSESEKIAPDSVIIDCWSNKFLKIFLFQDDSANATPIIKRNQVKFLSSWIIDFPK